MYNVPLLSRCELHDVFSTTTATASGSTLTAELTKLAALGRRAKRVGAKLVRPRLAALLFYTTHNATVGTTDGTIAGVRRHEAYRIQLAPDGWPVDYAIDADGIDLVHLERMQLGKAGEVAAAALASGDGAKSAEQMVPYFFDRPDGVRSRDGGVDPIAVGRGSLQMAAKLVGGGVAASGLTAQSISAFRIVAALDYDHPGLPVFSRFSSRNIQSQLPSGRLVFAGRRVEEAFMRVDGGQAAGTDHLAGSFEESRTMQLWLQGELFREDTRIDELIDIYNMAVIDAAIAQSRTVPEIVPIVGPYRCEKSTQLPGGDRDARIEFSGDIRDTATGTGRNVLLAVKEQFPVAQGTAEDMAYRNATGLPTDATMHRIATARRSNAALDASKADALPQRAKSSDGK